MSYPVPIMQWPTVTKKSHEDCILLSEMYGTTDGNWDLDISDSDAEDTVRALLRSYKVPVYHVTIDEFTDMGYVRGYDSRRPYVDSRYIYVWTFSVPKTACVHIYYQGGDHCDDPTCEYQKTVEADLLTNNEFDCKEIIGCLKMLSETQ